MTGGSPENMRPVVPDEQMALLGWGLLVLKEVEDSKEFYYKAGRYQGYRQAVEILRSEKFGWPDNPDLAGAYTAIGRSIVQADDIEKTTDGNEVGAGVQ